MQAFIDNAIMLQASMRNEIVRDMLGRWVSELEPIIQIEVTTGRPFGLTAKGHVKTFVEARS